MEGDTKRTEGRRSWIIRAALAVGGISVLGGREFLARRAPAVGRTEMGDTCDLGNEILSRWDLSVLGARAQPSSEAGRRTAVNILSGSDTGGWAVDPGALRAGVNVRVALGQTRPVKVFALHWAQWPVAIEYAINATAPGVATTLIDWRPPGAQREVIPVPDAELSEYEIRIRSTGAISDGSLLTQVGCFGRLAPRAGAAGAAVAGAWFGATSHLGYPEDGWWNGARELQALGAVGGRCVRMTARWDEMELTRGQYDPRRLRLLDEHVRLAHEGGFFTVLVVHGTPRWATRTPSATGAGAGIPSEPGPFADFVEMLYRRYGSQVDAWELWNEANTAYFFAQPNAESAAAFAALCRAAGQRLRGIDPGVRLLLGSTARVDVAFLLMVLDADPGPVDAIGVHPYTDGRDPLEWFDDRDLNSSSLFVLAEGRRYWRNLATLRTVLDHRGLEGTQLWITEMGWDLAGDTGIGEIRQVQFVESAYRSIASDLPGVTRVFWFSVKDWGGGVTQGTFETMGLVDGEWQPRAVGRAWQTHAATPLSGTVRLASLAPAGRARWRVYHGFPTGARRWSAMTSDGRPASLRVDGDGWLEVRDAGGAPCVHLEGA